MARKATSGGDRTSRSKSSKPAKERGSASASRAVVRSSSSGSSGNRSSARGNKDTMGDAFIKLLQSPLVADLLAVAATAALAALAEHGFSSRGAAEGASNKRAGRAVKEAGKAAAAAIGRRLSTEMEEIRAAAKGSSAKA